LIAKNERKNSSQRINGENGPGNCDKKRGSKGNKEDQLDNFDPEEEENDQRIAEDPKIRKFGNVTVRNLMELRKLSKSLRPHVQGILQYLIHQ
jgi:hypothetical protein